MSHSFWEKRDEYVVFLRANKLMIRSKWKMDLSARYSELLLLLYKYCKFPKYSDTQKICCNHSKIWTMWLYHRVMSPNDADGMANSVDPDQTALFA